MKSDDLRALLERYAADQDMFAPKAWADQIVSDLIWRNLWLGTMIGAIGATVLFLVLTVAR